MNVCVVVSAGRIADYNFIKSFIPEGAPVFAADAGFSHLSELGLEAAAIVGDFDSLTPGEGRAFPCVSYPPEKDDTDTLLAVKLGIEKGYDQFIMIGSLGGRFDHAFANATALAYMRDRDVNGIIIDDECAVFMLENGESYEPDKDDLLRPYGETISVFPFGIECATVTMEGVKYPVDTYELSASIPIGVSNKITDMENCKITVHAGKVLIIRAKTDTQTDIPQ